MCIWLELHHGPFMAVMAAMAHNHLMLQGAFRPLAYAQQGDAHILYLSDSADVAVAIDAGLALLHLAADLLNNEAIRASQQAPLMLQHFRCKSHSVISDCHAWVFWFDNSYFQNHLGRLSEQ